MKNLFRNGYFRDYKLITDPKIHKSVPRNTFAATKLKQNSFIVLLFFVNLWEKMCIFEVVS